MTDTSVRWGWLKGMYLYTAFGAGALGLALLLVPGWVAYLLDMPGSNEVVVGIVGSSYVAFGALSLLGIRHPLRCVPILLLQLTYKVVWLLIVLLPSALTGTTPPYAWLFGAVFLTYVIGDLIAIPFGYLFSDETDG